VVLVVPVPKDSSASTKSSPKKTEEELLARFRTLSSPSDFYSTDAHRDGVMTTSLSSIVASADKANQDRVQSLYALNMNQVVGSGNQMLNAVETNGSGNEKLNAAVETNDRSTAALFKIAKARSELNSSAHSTK
jgi:hypothetical protein